jgi:hypothetical protein
MSAPPGTPWVNADFLSPSRMTLMSFLKLTAAQANSLNPKFPGQAFFAKDSGFGFSQNGVYVLDAAGSTWLPLAGGKHNHSADDAVTGGFLSDILTANATKALFMQGNVVGDFMSTGTGTISEEPNSGRTALTCAAAGTFRHLAKGGHGLDFGRPSVFVFKGFSTANTQLSAKIGVCLENVNDAHTDTRKYGIEACDSAGSAQNWQIVSATGAGGSRTATAATENALQGAARGYKLVHNVGQSVQFFVNGTLNQTKSTNIPASGNNAINNISVGYKSNNATSKTLYVHYSRLAGSISDTAFA